MKGNDNNGLMSNKVIHYALQLLALSLLIFFCFEIIKPFITLIIWGTVLAITLYPMHKKFTNVLKGRKWISAGIITLIMLMLIVVPAILMMLATIDEFKSLTTAYNEGRLQIPLPDERVKEWPVIGEKLFEYWSEASENIKGFVLKNYESIKPYIMKVLSLFSSAGKGVLLLLASFLVGGILMVFGAEAEKYAKIFFGKLVGVRGDKMVDSVGITVRNVAKGVIGVAFIQGILAGTGMVMADVPFAGIWVLVAIILSIVQIGVFPVSIGVIIYIWTTPDTTTAILLTIWLVFVGVIDNIIRPLMIGMGAPVPMIVVFLGTIGGFLMSGFIGLFTGAIVLTLGYKLVAEWLSNGVENEPQQNNI